MCRSGLTDAADAARPVTTDTRGASNVRGTKPSKCHTGPVTISAGPFTTRAATAADLDAMLALLPRLADYELPANRTSDMFWQGDAELLRTWSTEPVNADGTAGVVTVRVGVNVDDTPVAVAIVSLNDDHFSHELNAHLEVLVVAPEADGHRVGRTLIAEMETWSAAQGAQTMSLHVLGNNHRARAVYAKIGFDEEMIRAIKFL